MGRPKKDNKEVSETKQEAFERTMKEMEQDFCIKKASDIEIKPKIRTGLYALDYVLSGGIVQQGCHMIEFYGQPSSGKSLLALKLIAKYQSLGLTTAYVDAECGFDPLWSQILGVNLDKLVLVEDKVLETIGDWMVRAMPVTDLIVVDSIPALIPKEESEGKSLEDKYMASIAKVMSPFCRKINEVAPKCNTTIVFINQLREKVGVMFGNPLNTPAGRALKHMLQTRIEFKNAEAITHGVNEEKEQIGMNIKIHAFKNKAGVPKRTSSFSFYFNGEIDNTTSLLYAGIKLGIITLEGRTYTWKDLKVVGEDKFKEALTDKYCQELESEIWKIQK